MTEAEAIARYPGAGSFRFGDSRALNAQILDLVRQGRKTVTCDAVAGFARRSEPLPEPGRTDIALDWDGVPVLAIRTVDLAFMPFSAMTEDLVADQGEFRDIDDWRAGYRAYLTRAGLFSPDAEMLVERFTVVEVFA
ncbi:ASCH domain-containing protein [Seohaeicola saemankumensis]|uniref:ASCH domain-containing protein n=1 Tax=Seohaeicola TaxID=481178 RepID=UPI0035D06F40